MCGRFNLITNADAYLAFFGVWASIWRDRYTSYNIAPGTAVPIVTAENDQRRDREARWGLVPSWSPEPRSKFSTINARSESVETSRLYRGPFQRRRCLVPATGYYEWEKGPKVKQPYHVSPAQGGLIAFAGIYDVWGEGEQGFSSFSILTTDANETLSSFHHRMPVILAQADFEAWLCPEDPKDKHLLVPCPDEWLKIYPVSTFVNKTSNNSPECIKPLI